VADLFVRDLRVARDGRVVLDGCSAVFTAGRRTVLWGRSGAGKSTLLAAIAGLLSPQAGTIELGSHVFFSRSDGIERAPHERGVGFVFQDLALWPHLTAIEQVELVGRAAGLDRRGALALLESVGLGATRTPPPASFGRRAAAAGDRRPAASPRSCFSTSPSRGSTGRRGCAARPPPRAVSPGSGTDDLRDAQRRGRARSGVERDEHRGRQARHLRASLGRRRQRDHLSPCLRVAMLVCRSPRRGTSSSPAALSGRSRSAGSRWFSLCIWTILATGRGRSAPSSPPPWSRTPSSRPPCPRSPHGRGRRA
jgi:predicted ABC-type transport system involved in lysophospholipase L1 biosynthesis ATPase subunit